VISCLDRSMRAFDGVPTYWLIDDEKSVSSGTYRWDGGPAFVDRAGRPPVSRFARRTLIPLSTGHRRLKPCVAPT
jgi:hypothetical protein